MTLQAILKRIAFFFFCFAVFNSHAQDLQPNHLLLPEQPFTIPFTWKADSINGKWDEHAAMLIPVRLDNCPQKFYMQFDLGVPSSLFYTNKMLAVRDRFAKVIDMNDTTAKLTTISFFTGKTKLLAREIALKQAGTDGINWKEGTTEIIGTLGTDLIDNRLVIIDYPGKKLLINVPGSDTGKLKMNSLIYSGRRILFPSIIKGKRTILYFDTGSSAFELLTDKETAQSLSIHNAIPVIFKVNSWGRTLEATSLPTNDSLQMGDLKLPVKYATFIEGASDSQIKQMMKLGIGGMTGNKLFIQSRLLLDLKNKRFAIIPPAAKRK